MEDINTSNEYSEVIRLDDFGTINIEVDAMLKDLFSEFIELSRGLRPEYPNSLGDTKKGWANVITQKSYIPKFFEVIYSSIQGTKRDITDQKLMDFIPGYRLIHVDEFIVEKRKMDNILSKPTSTTIVLPFLSNYSNDFICYVERLDEREGYICALLHDDRELNLMCITTEKFLETINEFYKQNVFFLDDDGYLDYDYVKEGIIGSNLNPGIKYWTN